VLHTPIGQRLADIRARYGPAHPVTRALARSAPELETPARRVACQLSARTRDAVPAKGAAVVAFKAVKG